MDAHYHQVMKKREQINSDKTRSYFAYSTILDMPAFNEWAQQHSYQFFQLPKGQLAELKDAALIFNFPSRWWGGLAASLTDKSGSSVFGMLFEIPEKEWPIIQHKEGFITNMCVEKTVQVQVGGKTVEATAFVTNPARASLEGEISQRFIKALLQGAESSGLPKNYIDGLKGYLNT